MNRYLFRWRELFSLLTVDLKSQHEFDVQIERVQTDKSDPANVPVNTKGGQS